MHRKLARRNKSNLSQHFKRLRKPICLCLKVNRITYESIELSKKKGQSYHWTRISRLQRMNSRQLKKLRKKQQRLGLLGSKYGGICTTPLKPASTILIKK